jgi:hypothetical protein
VRNNGIRAYNAMLTQDHTGKDTGAVADECMGSETNRPLANQLLVNEQAFLWVHTVAVIANVYVFAEQTSVFDHDAENCGDATISADVDILPENDLRMKLNPRVRIQSTQPTETIHRRASTDTYELSSIDAPWAIDVRARTRPRRARRLAKNFSYQTSYHVFRVEHFRVSICRFTRLHSHQRRSQAVRRLGPARKRKGQTSIKQSAPRKLRAPRIQSSWKRRLV